MPSVGLHARDALACACSASPQPHPPPPLYSNCSRDRGPRAFLEAAGAIVVLFCLSWRLAPACSIVIVVTALAAGYYRRKSRPVEQVRTCVCMCVCVSVVGARMHVCVRVWMCGCVWVCEYGCVVVCGFVCVCVCACVSTSGRVIPVCRAAFNGARGRSTSAPPLALGGLLRRPLAPPTAEPPAPPSAPRPVYFRRPRAARCSAWGPWHTRRWTT
jgi:hypothetical protein